MNFINVIIVLDVFLVMLKIVVVIVYVIIFILVLFGNFIGLYVVCVKEILW